MEKSICYQAQDENSFGSLAKLIVCCGAVVNVNPKTRVIVVSVDESQTKVFNEIGEVIDANALNFKIVEQGELAYQQRGQKLLQELEDARKKSEQYYKWYTEATDKYERLKKQLGAISTIIEAISR